MCRRTECPAEIVREAAEVRPAAARHVERHVRQGDVYDLQLVDRHLARREFYRFAAACRDVGGAAFVLHRAKRRRPLHKRATKGRERCCDRRGCQVLPLRRGRDVARGVVRIGCATEADRGEVALGRTRQILQYARPGAEAKHKHARGQRIERAAVANLALARETSHASDDIMRGWSGGLVDREQAVQHLPFGHGGGQISLLGCWRWRASSWSVRTASLSSEVSRSPRSIDVSARKTSSGTVRSERSRARSSCRRKPSAACSALSVDCRCSSVPSTLTNTRAWRKSGEVSTEVIEISPPRRGSFNSRWTRSLISSRKSSLTRSARWAIGNTPVTPLYSGEMEMAAGERRGRRYCWRSRW